MVSRLRLTAHLQVCACLASRRVAQILQNLTHITTQMNHAKANKSDDAESKHGAFNYVLVCSSTVCKVSQSRRVYE